MLEGYDYPHFIEDERTRRAVCMTLINIGELVKALSDGMRRQYPKTPWKAIAGLRDVTAHHYQTLRDEDIWVTVNQDIPAFIQQLLAILGDLETGSGIQ
jgi:uncharacterized protein with HEPN domain